KLSAKISKKKVKELFKRVKLLLLDVDGVLTKGEIIYDSQDGEAKIFNVKDGLGVSLLGRMGINVVLITAKNSPVVRRRAKDMRADIYGGILPKEDLLPQLEKKYSVNSQQICFVGDDLIDIGIMRRVGIPVAVSDASFEVRKTAVYVTCHKGGEGAVREIVELILKSKSLWHKAIKEISALKA
ncbi:MAG: HAD-IIIA family hydrolase, partial [Candidatus Omnitrophota bacterium]